jgi:hypothetical protein
MPFASKIARVAADIRAEAKTDSLIDAEEKLNELREEITHARTMTPAMAAIVFGSDANWRIALARMGVEAGRRSGEVERMRIANGQSLNIDMEQIARPVATGSGVRFTGC